MKRLFKTVSAAESHTLRLRTRGIPAFVRYQETRRADGWVDRWLVVSGDRARRFYNAHLRVNKTEAI